jgi:hypothetical protein
MESRLLNVSEEKTFIRLLGVAEERAARVFPKMRIADVLPINNSGIDSDLFRFALQSHFDFVVASDGYTPLFAVEFDGPLHKRNALTRSRDTKKNVICERFEFQLLRVNSRYIDSTYRGMDLLTYFANVWFLEQDFYQARIDGYMPWDEPFDPCMVLNDGQRKEMFPYWLSVEEQVYIQHLCEKGHIPLPGVSEWVGVDDEENYFCFAWLQVAKNSFVISKTGMRNQRFPVDITDILRQISVFDIRRELDRYFDFENNIVTEAAVNETRQRYAATYEMRACGTVSKYTPE